MGEKTLGAPQGSIGAYGLRLTGVDGAARILRPAAASWPTVAIRVTTAEEVKAPAEDVLTPERAEVRVQGGGLAVLTRVPRRVSLTFRGRPPDEHIVHPFLSTSAAILNRWLQRETFHAAALHHAGGAWALLGHKGAGKSSTLGWLVTAGIPAVTDDLLVVADGNALAGPACVDLRPDAAARLGVGDHLGVVGARERCRVLVDQGPDHLPLRGFVLLTWGATVEVATVPLPQRLPVLAQHLALRRAPLAAERFLALSALPLVVLQRPREWSSLPAAAGLLLRSLR